MTRKATPELVIRSHFHTTDDRRHQRAALTYLLSHPSGPAPAGFTDQPAAPPSPATGPLSAISAKRA